MSDVSVHPIAQGGFDKRDLSQIYDQVRPSYSKDVVNFLLDKLGISISDASSDQPLRIIELGAGTGKFTGTLQEVLSRDSKVQIIASEPLLSMREELKKKHPDMDIQDFLAENIGRPLFCFLCCVNNSFHLMRNMLGNLTAVIISSEKRTVFRERSNFFKNSYSRFAHVL